MNKLLHLLGVIALLAIALAMFASSSPADAGDSGKLNFKTATTAICEEKADSVYCHDEVLVVCGDETYILPKITGRATCGRLKMEVPPITSFAVFDKDWKDPREGRSPIADWG